MMGRLENSRVSTGGRSEPLRQCVVSRRRAPRSTLLRLSLGTEGRPYVDILGREPDRGIYVAPESLGQALSPKGLKRVFGGKARALEPDEIQALLEGTVGRLEARMLELLGLARRAGGVEIGAQLSRSFVHRNAGNSGKALLLVDFENAHNTPDRALGLAEVRARCPASVTPRRASSTARIP